MRYIIVAVRDLEKDYLDEPEEYTIHGDGGSSMTMVRHKSLAARFVNEGIDKFNTKVAKFWARFEQFMEMLYFFGVADLKSAEELVLSVGDQGPKSSDLDPKSPSAKIGLGWFAK